MAITEAALTGDTSNTTATVYTTASITTSETKLTLLAIANRSPDADPASLPVPTSGITWVEVDNQLFVGGDLCRLSVFRAMGAATGAITITYDQSQNRCRWSVAEFDGVDTGGTNGSAAVVQSAKNVGTTETTLTATLAAFGSSNNATYGAFASSKSTDESHTPGTGFTEIHDLGTTFLGLETEWRADNDTTVDATVSASGIGLAIIGIEIKAAGGASDTPINPGVANLTLSGFAPTVSQTAHQSVSPGVASLTLTGFAPTVSQTANQEVSPGTASLTLTGFAPTVVQSGSINLEPATANFTLTGFAPTVTQTVTQQPRSKTGLLKMNLTKYVLTGTTLAIDAKVFTYPLSVTLTSSDAGRKIELSFDNGATFHIPTYDFSTASQLVVAIQVPFSDLKITGAAADTVWVAQGRQGVAA